MRRRWASSSGITRLASITLILILVLLSINVLEVRKTAYSCRTVWSCLGLTGWHSPAYIPQDRSRVSHSETVLRDGTTRFERRYNEAQKSDLLILVLSRDHTSWSNDFRSSPRSIHDLLDLLASTGLDLSYVSLALLTDSNEEYASIVSSSDRLALSRMTVFLRSASTVKAQDEGISYTNRHDPRVQLSRRSRLATIRNHLMLRSLEDESHILWLDADVLELSPNIIQTMIKHSDSKPEAGIITAECHQNQMENYDKNAWQVDSPSLLGAIAEGNREDAVAKLVEQRVMLPELIKGTHDEDLLPLDAVGGTILYIRADLVRNGLTFPQYNAVGTTWAKTGWIGVETEGLCYAAKDLPGGHCFVLGGRHHVRHTDWG